MLLSAGEHHVADTARCSRTCDGGGGSSAGGDKGGSGACSSTGASAPRRSAAQDERRAKGLLSANLGKSRRISANLGESRTGTTSVAKGEATAPLPRPPPWSGDSGRPSGSYFAEAGGPIGMAIGGLIAALLWQGRRVPGMKGRMRRSRGKSDQLEAGRVAKAAARTALWPGAAARRATEGRGARGMVRYGERETETERESERDVCDKILIWTRDMDGRWRLGPGCVASRAPEFM